MLNPPPKTNQYSHVKNLSHKISSFAIDFTVTQLSVYIVDHSTAKREGYWLKEGERMAFLFMLCNLDLWSEEVICLSQALERRYTTVYISLLFSVLYSHPDEYEYEAWGGVRRVFCEPWIVIFFNT